MYAVRRHVSPDSDMDDPLDRGWVASHGRRLETGERGFAELARADAGLQVVAFSGESVGIGIPRFAVTDLLVIKLFPEPVISRNCFGKCSLLAGQKRDPTPPAMMRM